MGAVKLLIVEDSSLVYRRLIDMLGGIERLTALSIARSVREAVDKSRCFLPDAVVLDIHLPDGNGLDAMRQIRANCPTARVYIFSNRLEYRHEALAAGADAFFDKSLDFELLIAHLMEMEPHS